MADRLIKMDYERGKVIVMRTTVDLNGNTVEQQVELDLPKNQTTKGLLRKVKRGDDGRLYETEEVIEMPILEEHKEEE